MGNPLKSLGKVAKAFVGGLAGTMGIGTGLSLASDALGAWSSREQQEDNLHAQREFAQQGIRWKVADALAAGVSPLFALGASTAAYSPNPVVPMDFSNTAAAASAAVSNATLKEREAKVLEIQERQVRSQELRDLAEAQKFASEAALNRQRMGSMSPFPETYTSQWDYKMAQVEGMVPEDKLQVFNPYSDAIIRRVDPILWNSDDGIPLEERGGLDPSAPTAGWKRVDFGDGPIALPRFQEDQLMSDLQDMDNATRLAIIAENRKRYGEAGARRIMALFDMVGKAPVYGGSHEKNPRVGPGGGYIRQ